jgi:hypothetical protein
MRRISLSFALMMVLLGLCDRAFADGVAIGTFSFDPVFAPTSQSPGLDSFDISDYTGGSSLPTIFPVATSLNFGNLDLVVTNADGTVTSYSEGSAGEGSTFFFDTLVYDTQTPLDATLNGTISPITIALSDGSTINIGGNFTAVLDPSLGSALTAGVDSTTIFASPQAVPEPSSLLLLCSGLALAGISLKRLLW